MKIIFAMLAALLALTAVPAAAQRYHHGHGHHHHGWHGGYHHGYHRHWHHHHWRHR